MSLVQESAALSGRNPESTYGEPTSYSTDYESNEITSDESSHIEFTPDDPNTTPPTHTQLGLTADTSDVHTTPSHRSSSPKISQNTRNALEAFYKHVYGNGSKFCLLTLKEASWGEVTIAHIVQRGSPTQMVRNPVVPHMEYDL
jgi:hypothetical protein